MALDECWSCDYTHEVSGSVQGHTFLKMRRKKVPFECVSSRKCFFFFFFVGDRGICSRCTAACRLIVQLAESVTGID